MKEELFMVDELTDQNFETETKNGVVLTDFWATWCGPCKMQSPIIDELAQERQDVRFTKMDVDQNKETPSSLGIMAIPTLIIKKNGEVVDRLTGYTPKAKLDQILSQYTD
jgi:thioredoxin 1